MARRPLREVYDDYRVLGAALRGGADDEAGLDARLAAVEAELERGECRSPDDVLAKGLYLSEAHALDPGQVSATTVATLLAGIRRWMARTPVQAAA